MGVPQERPEQRQPMLPGMDQITQAAQAFAAEATQRGQESRVRDVRRALVLPVQRVVLQEFEALALNPRRAIWGETTDILTMHTPKVSWTASHYDVGDHGEVTWTIPRLVHGEEQDSQVTTVVETRKINFTENQDNRALGDAIRYYVKGNEAFPWKRLPKTLLDVPHQGAWGFKGAHFPKDRLAQRITEEALRLTKHLYVTVTSQLLGSTELKELMRFEVTNENNEVPTYLDPRNADGLLGKFDLPDQEIPVAAMARLREDYLSDSFISLPRGYRQLNEVNTFLISTQEPQRPNPPLPSPN